MTDSFQDTDLATFLDIPERRHPWRWWLAGAWLAVFMILALRAVLFVGTGTDYATVPITQENLVVAVTATGNLKSTRQIDIGSETSGLVEQVYVDNNDRVRKGQPLARFDTARLNDALTQAQAGVAQAQTQVAASDASVADAREQLERYENVARQSGGKVPSQLELVQARNALTRAQANDRSAHAQVATARAQASTARTNVEKATIYSPVSGTVLSRKVEPGQTVAASFQVSTLFTIAEDLSQMRLDVKVDEADIGHVAAGQQASFKVDAWPGEVFPAVVERVDVGSTSNASSSGSGTVVSYIARLALANPQGKLRPGMTATATIISQTIARQWVVPLAALHFAPPEPAKGGFKFQPPAPPEQQGAGTQQIRIGPGSAQRVYLMGADKRLIPEDVTVLAVVGSKAAVRGAALAAGQRVVTGTLSGAK